MIENNYEKEINKLKELKNIINNLPNNKMKMMLIYNYESLADYLIELGYLESDFIEKAIPIDYEEYEKKFSKIEDGKYFESFYNNYDLIYKIINDNVELHKKHELQLLYSSRNVYRKINGKDLQKIMDNFFISLGLDVYNIYQKIGNNFLTFANFNDNRYLGFTFDVSMSDYPRVIVDSKRNLYQVGETLAHEIGHCYDMVRNKTNYNLYRYNLLVEVPSILFQKLFNLFLYETPYYQNDALNNMLNWKYTVMAMSLGCSLIPNTSFYGREDKLDYNSEFAFLFECSGILDENLLKAIEIHPVSFENFRYVIGDTIANNLINIYKNNPKEGLKEIKNFIATIHQYTVKEQLERYGNISNESEKEIQKLYQFQKNKLYL